MAVKAVVTELGAGTIPSYLLTYGIGDFASGPASYVLTADVGTFTLSGQTATLTMQRLLTVEVGAYSLSGQSAVLIGPNGVVDGGGLMKTLALRRRRHSVVLF